MGPLVHRGPNEWFDRAQASRPSRSTRPRAGARCSPGASRPRATPSSRPIRVHREPSWPCLLRPRQSWLISCMLNVSGVQLCRLLGSEPATAGVPVISCAEHDDPRNRFWAERAGAFACVAKGRTAELVRSLGRAIASRPAADDFFVQLSGGSVDIQDWIARQLDRALFDTVIAGEVRSPRARAASSGCSTRSPSSSLVLMRYRWMALRATPSDCWALHRHPSTEPAAEEEARRALGVSDGSPVPLHRGRGRHQRSRGATGRGAHRDVRRQPSGSVRHLRARRPGFRGSSLGEVVARELGGPLKMTSLIEESQRMASTDPDRPDEPPCLRRRHAR